MKIDKLEVNYRIVTVVILVIAVSGAGSFSIEI